MEKIKIFSYGTLMDERLQELLYSRKIDYKEAVLDGYAINTWDEYYNIIKKENSHIKGRVLTFTKDEVFYTDQWESVPFYTKKKVIAKIDGKDEEVLVYIKSEKEDGEKFLSEIEGLSNNDNFLKSVKKLSENRDIINPISDILISFPIMEKKNIVSFKSNTILEEVKKIIDKENKIYNIGTLDFEYKNEIYLTSICFVETRENQDYIKFIFPISIKNAVELYEYFSSGNIKIAGKNLDRFVEENLGIKVDDDFTLTSFLQDEPSDKFVENFFDNTNYNKVELDIGRSYISKNKKMVIMKDFSIFFKKRLEKELKTFI